MNHLKQVDIALWMFAEDHTNQFPMQTYTEYGGTRELVAVGHVCEQFNALKPYSGGPNFYNMLICPGDVSRHPDLTGATLTDSNISYFLNPDAEATNSPTTTALLGDRDLTVNGQAAKPGLLTLTSSTQVDWGKHLHPKVENVAFADGHVEMIKTGMLARVLAPSAAATNRLLIP